MDKFFQMHDNVDLTGRWWLGSLNAGVENGMEPYDFLVGRRLAIRGPATISIRREGVPLDFTFADFDLPVANQRVALILRRLCHSDYQEIDSNVEGRTERYSVINVLNSVSCVDESRTRFVKWGPNDGRPEKVGKYRQIVNLHIDPNAVEGHKMFRVAGWQIALVIDEEIKSAMTDANVTGVIFTPVT